MRRLRAAGCAAALVAVLAACGGAGSPQPEPSGPPRSLRILLVNDDGWDAPGITVLRQALVAAGHRVTEVGPAGAESGTGGAVTLTGPGLQLIQRQPEVWSVSGRPADAALVGLRRVMAASPPELVVSGINSDYNLGSTVVHSGTVGAALTAAELGVPAIAASTKVADSANPTPADYGPSADHLVRLVGALSARPERPTPPGVILNVNYPRGTTGAVGVTAADVSATPSTGVAYTEVAPGLLAPKPEPVAPDPNGSTDIAAVARGQVAISALDVDFATGPEARDAAVRAAGSTGP